MEASATGPKSSLQRFVQNSMRQSEVSTAAIESMRVQQKQLHDTYDEEDQEDPETENVPPKNTEVEEESRIRKAEDTKGWEESVVCGQNEESTIPLPRTTLRSLSYFDQRNFSSQQ